MGIESNEEERRLVIVGTGGLGRQLHELIEDIQDAKAGTQRLEMLGWLDSNPEVHGAEVHGLPVLGDLDWIKDHAGVEVVIAVATPHNRRKVVERLHAYGHTRFATLIHPTAIIGRRVSIGEGTVICSRVNVNTDLQIGRHVLVNGLSTIAHDDVIHDYVSIAPSANISGNVTLGEGVDFGTNATVNQGLQIGAWSIVGSGAVVVKSLPANCTAVGVPAKLIRQRPEGWHL